MENYGNDTSLRRYLERRQAEGLLDFVVNSLSSLFGVSQRLIIDTAALSRVKVRVKAFSYGGSVIQRVAFRVCFICQRVGSKNVGIYSKYF